MTINELSIHTPESLAAQHSDKAAAVAERNSGVEHSRVVAEIQAALIVASGRPRNEIQARDALIRACQRVGLARSGVYQYPRGGQSVTGASIRLAEAAARAWGNMSYGFREIGRADGASDVEAFAWDLETNTRAVRVFRVKHWRDTRGGGYLLTDERDIYELLANQAQRRVRACILEIIPGDIIDDAMEQCSVTLQADIGDPKKTLAEMISAFAAVGVTREQLGRRLGCRIDDAQPAQIIGLRRVYSSIRDGMSTVADWFPPIPQLDEAPATATPAPAPAAEPEPAKPAKSGKKATSILDEI